jgi:hypothetical protein
VASEQDILALSLFVCFSNSARTSISRARYLRLESMPHLVKVLNYVQRNNKDVSQMEVQSLWFTCIWRLKETPRQTLFIVLQREMEIYYGNTVGYWNEMHFLLERNRPGKAKLRNCKANSTKLARCEQS